MNLKRPPTPPEKKEEEYFFNKKLFFFFRRKEEEYLINLKIDPDQWTEWPKDSRNHMRIVGPALT